MNKIVTNYFKINNRKAGFAMLYAVLLGSLMMAIGIAIAGIASRELVLSSAGKESQFAFYAADTGAECALYWDITQGIFSTSTDPATACNFNPAYCMKCNNLDVSPISWVHYSGVGGNEPWWVTSFRLPLGAVSNQCAVVTIKKQYIDMAGSPHVATIVESRGRNDCGIANNPRRVERGIRVTY
ncbi:MAG: hypothetical protein WCT19_03605 [Candidatus Paceibacterota bacterium]|jgi:hypothetical protein